MMRRIPSNDLIEKFIQEKKAELFPNLSNEEVKFIINYPFHSFRRLLKSNIIETFRIKYLGNFTVHKKKAEIEYSKLDEKLKNGIINIEKYEQSKKSIQEYLKKIK